MVPHFQAFKIIVIETICNLCFSYIDNRITHLKLRKIEQSGVYPHLFPPINKIKVPMVMMSLLTLKFPATVQRVTT